MAWTFFRFWWWGEVDVRELAPQRARTHAALNWFGRTAPASEVWASL